MKITTVISNDNKCHYQILHSPCVVDSKSNNVTNQKTGFIKSAKTENKTLAMIYQNLSVYFIPTYMISPNTKFHLQRIPIINDRKFHF